MTQHDAAADLAFIRQHIEQTRRYTAAKGVFFVIWGVAVSLSLLLTWLQVAGALGGSQWAIWIPTTVVAWSLTLWFAWKQQQESAVPHHAHLIGMNWTAIGVAMMAVFFVGVGRGTLGYAGIPGLSAILVGVGIFNTGHLSGLRWLAAVGVVWLVAGALMLAFPGLHNLPAMALLLVFGQIAPGLVLMRAERAAQRGAAA